MPETLFFQINQKDPTRFPKKIKKLFDVLKKTLVLTEN